MLNDKRYYLGIEISTGRLVEMRALLRFVVTISVVERATKFATAHMLDQLEQRISGSL